MNTDTILNNALHDMADATDKIVPGAGEGYREFADERYGGKMSHERITLTDNAQSAIAKLSEGNPGALNVCCQLYQETPEIDPDAAFGGLSSLLALDTLGIYGAEIWMLFKDVCGQNLSRTVAVLRANQLGLLSDAKLKRAIQNRGEGVDTAEMFNAVCDRLPNFAKANALEMSEVV